MYLRTRVQVRRLNLALRGFRAGTFAESEGYLKYSQTAKSVYFLQNCPKNSCREKLNPIERVRRSVRQLRD